VVVWSLALALPMLAGIVLGNRQFGRTDPARFRRYVLMLLAALSLAVLLVLMLLAALSLAVLLRALLG
jgi:hypothetical protein